MLAAAVRSQLAGVKGPTLVFWSGRNLATAHGSKLPSDSGCKHPQSTTLRAILTVVL